MHMNICKIGDCLIWEQLCEVWPVIEVYGDILFLENLVINYLILLVTAKFSMSRTSNLRLFLGSMVGASYVLLMILLPELKVFTTFMAKFLLSFAIIAVAFHFEKLVAFLKTLALFYATTFIFAGAGFALLYFTQNGGVVRNGVIITALPLLGTKWTQVLLAIAVAGIVIRVFWDIIQYKFIKEKLLVQLMISFDNKAIVLYALVDTGNSLHDPLTNMPVVVVEFNAIKEILPVEIRSIFEETGENDLNSMTKAISCSSWFSRFRLIPFTSLGKENGMLIGFRPDFIEIDRDNEKKGISDVIIGIYNKALSKNEKYKALLSPELM
jgi:stage II sporulation protein GA (sporulation sigma-E factor processing peptidase)